MKVSLFLLSLFFNCVNLEELNKVQPINYLYSVVIANLRNSQAGSGNLATFQIQGTLKDSSGNPIANAILSLGVSQNIVSREAVTTSTTTDSNGNYTLNLKVGNFSVKVTDSSGVEIGAFRLNATSATEKPSIAVTSGSLSLVVNVVTNPAPVSPIVAPSNLSYPSSVLNLNVGTVMTALTPSVSGTVTLYSVSPSLPTGLILNPSSGMISGTPLNSQSAIGYTITASNRGGSSSYPITISIANIQNNLPPPSDLTYSSSFLKVDVGSSVYLSPTVSGIVSSYSIEPTTLPNGLIFNTNSGLLSGTTNTVSSVSTYTISAINSGGSSTFTIQITVNMLSLVSMPFGILKTGNKQNLNNFYEDGDYQIGNERKFIDGNNEGLVWLKCSIGQELSDKCLGNAEKINWNDAKSKCENLNYGGRSDWRLPNYNELLNLTDHNNYIDNNLFPNTLRDWYWTSNENKKNQSERLAVNYGSLNSFPTNYLNSARCISGESNYSQILEVKSDFLIFDNRTKLFWMRCSLGQSIDNNCTGLAQKMEWLLASDECEKLNYGGRNDWRLPNINELRSIVSYDNINPSINTNYFPNTVFDSISGSVGYWSSTRGSLTQLAFYIDFSYGRISENSHNPLYAVRCVSGP